MTISLHTIKPGKKVKRKRIGRGNASGTGTYSGKGLKGQKARSGVSNLKRLGMKQVLLRTPKLRGFKSLRPKNQVINLSVINENYQDKSIINLESLLSLGLIDNAEKPVKILGKGKLTLKNLLIKGIKTSDSAKGQIEKLKGKIAK